MLTDELLLDILGLIGNPRDLCAFICASTGCYVLGNVPDLWRALVITDCVKDHNKVLQYTHSWKDTAMRMMHSQKRNRNADDGGIDSENISGSKNNVVFAPKHIPRAFRRYYSDYLFQVRGYHRANTVYIL